MNDEDPELRGAEAVTAVVASACALIVADEAAGQGLTDDERRLVSRVEAHAAEAVDFLERIVNINSGTMNHEGVRRVGAAFADPLRGLGFDVRWVEAPVGMRRAGHLFAERRGGSGPHLLLIGHLDTVFESDSPFQTFTRSGDTATGPGVDDMKGGDVVVLYALRALDDAGLLERMNITVAFTGDEEDPGRPLDAARHDLIEAGKQADFALGFEGGVGSAHSATVARRGSSNWTLRVRGRRAHSSGIFGDQAGSGAVFEAARILTGFHEEVRGEPHLTFNPGIILGGTKVEYDGESARGTAFGKTNVIAREVVVEGGLRFISPDQETRARAAMERVVARHLPETDASIEFRDGYPAMPPTEANHALLERFDQVSRDLGFGPVTAVDPGARGAADISFVAPHTAGLAGLGPFGDGGHAINESLSLDSLRTSTLKAALLLYRLGRER